MGVRERKVERRLDKLATDAGSITRKWVSPGMDGVPDRIVISPVKVSDMIARLQLMSPDAVVADFNLVEVKTVDGRLSQVQEREHARLRDVGANVFTVFGEEGVECWVREVL